MTRVTNLSAKLRILEISAFTGVVSVSLARLGYSVTASDIPFVLRDPELQNFLISEGVAVCPVDLANAKFPLKLASFDLVIFNEVIEHLNFNPIPLLREFHRLLDAGGRVYCATPNLLAAKNR